MAYVRRRTTKAEAVSTALVESYRDENGRPRQRLLANLHGEPDTLRALAKLAARREVLRKEREVLGKEAGYANQFYETVTHNALHGHQYDADQRKEVDGLLKKRERLLQRLARVDRDLATIERDGAVINKHCTATADEIQDAIRTYKEELHRAECLVLGSEFALQQGRVKFRRKQRV
jgi:hypothetical protein